MNGDFGKLLDDWFVRCDQAYVEFLSKGNELAIVGRTP